MIREDLLEFQYYLDKLSMFMKESYGITEQVEIFYRQLYEVNIKLDYFFSKLNIFENQIEIPHDILDVIGSIFGLYRQFTIQVNNQDIQIDLNDEDFLTYIKCQIVKQNFKGTYEEIKKLYTTDDTQALYTGMNFIYNLTESMLCRIYFSNYTNYDTDIQNLFLAGYLTVESMGISYQRVLQNIGNLSMFAPEGEEDLPDYYYFDKGYFA